MLLVSGVASANEWRGVDFAGCKGGAAFKIADVLTESEELSEAQEAQWEEILGRIRRSFAGCGRMPEYDWIEIHGDASDATLARELVQSRLDESLAASVHFAAVGKGASEPIVFDLRRAAGRV